MPGRQAVSYGGLEFRVSPDFWLRRWLRFPFYFESHNPSFRVDIRRLQAEPPNTYWPSNSLVFEVVFADKTVAGRQYAKPQLGVGKSTLLVLDTIYTAYPGQTIIRLPIGPGDFLGGQGRWQTLFSYQVRTEEQLWLSLFTAALAIITSIGATAPGWTKLFN